MPILTPNPADYTWFACSLWCSVQITICGLPLNFQAVLSSQATVLTEKLGEQASKEDSLLRASDWLATREPLDGGEPSNTKLFAERLVLVSVNLRTQFCDLVCAYELGLA